MFFRQVLYPDLGCASYIVGDAGEAVVIDPRWSIDVYLETAAAERLRITHVIDTHERYQAKRTSPISIRGRDNKGRREYSADHGNRHVVNQDFEMNLLPETSVLYQVEADR